MHAGGITHLRKIADLRRPAPREDRLPRGRRPLTHNHGRAAADFGIATFNAAIQEHGEHSEATHKLFPHHWSVAQGTCSRRRPGPRRRHRRGPGRRVPLPAGLSSRQQAGRRHCRRLVTRAGLARHPRTAGARSGNRRRRPGRHQVVALRLNVGILSSASTERCPMPVAIATMAAVRTTRARNGGPLTSPITHRLRSALAGCDAVVHLAAFLGPRQAPDWEVHHNNVLASYNALTRPPRSGSPDLPGVERQRHWWYVQPRAPVRLFPAGRGSPQLHRGPLQPVQVDLRAAGRVSSPGGTKGSWSPACVCTCASKTAAGRSRCTRRGPTPRPRTCGATRHLASAAGACLLAIEAGLYRPRSLPDRCP